MQRTNQQEAGVICKKRRSVSYGRRARIMGLDPPPPPPSDAFQRSYLNAVS